MNMVFRFGKHSAATGSILFPLFVILLLTFTTKASEKLPENGTFPALIAFGDSILDTGNNNNLLTVTKCNFPPYGKNFDGGKATGRFCNGEILTDLVAQGLGIKETVPPYLDPNLQIHDLTTGVSFASGGSGLDPLTSSLQDVISITNQLNYFKDYMQKLNGIIGKEKANHIISNSLFLLSSGNNDIAISYFGLPYLRPLQYDAATYISNLVLASSNFIKDLYGLGARKIVVFSTLPLGCLPAARTILGGPSRRCAENVNQVAQLFNSKLSSELNKLMSSLPQATIVYVDLYNPILGLIENPELSGFNVSDKGCCATGLIELGPLCNQFMTSFTCSDVSKYVFWDSVHPSEKVYRIFTPSILETVKNNIS